MKRKLPAVGTPTSILLPKELLNRFKVKVGNVLFAVETPEGHLLTPYDPQVEERVKIGRGSCRDSGIHSAHWQSGGTTLLGL